MKRIVMTKKGFPGSGHQCIDLPFTEKDLLRAVIAAGRNWRKRKKSVAEQADIDMRVNALRSALNMSGPSLTPTPEFLESGSTDKAHKSYYIGNAICAHGAYVDLKIPWLVDMDKLYPGKKRPDFLGLDVRGNYHVFESKGRSSSPGKEELDKWKEQAKSVSRVKELGKLKKQSRFVSRAGESEITFNIVSAAYINRAHEWELLWVDPPSDPEDLLVFDKFSFFDAYYSEIITLIDRSKVRIDSAYGELAYLPEIELYLGIHKEIREGYERREAEVIKTFAARRMESETPEASTGFEPRLYADGIIIQDPKGEALRNAGRVLWPETITENSGEATESSPMTQKPQLGQSERATQNRVVALFRDELGYRYLINWRDRDDNSNIEEYWLADFLSRSGYSAAQINKAIHALRTEADNHSRGLYGNNKAVYSLLRYGVPVKVEAGKITETVHLINWAEPEKNDFAIAEEVTLRGNHERRPDIVLYVNGIAVGVLELKNSREDIGKGIRQSLSNQQPEFNEWFFSTVQFIFAGNDSEGLRYGTIGTEEKYFLKWKEDEQDDTRFKLDKYLLKLCDKARLIELMRDFVLFDGGEKKLPRAHQYFGVKEAQQRVRERKGGIIWHTQGSGKSIVMVLLAKWILENKPNARVAIITDRDELDKQIQGVFAGAGEPIERTSSGRNLMRQLGQATPRLLCSLVHKFGRKGVDNFEEFIKELEAQPSRTVGEIFVFVDECHRTQSGKLHRVMKAIMPNAVFIGFTGTPLLKKDKATSLEVFGGYIHTYKFGEAVEDDVVLDLVYEARDIDQRLGSEDKIDAWFEAKTRGLNDWQKDELKKQWGTMQKVLSSKSRMERVVCDIVFDFGVRPRLSDNSGNAMLVASSIYEACKYFTLFQKTVFKGKCAVVTSYNPLTKDITTENTGANTETDKEFIYNTYAELLKDVAAKPGMTKTETYEEQAKKLFKEEPANMKLLVVVDKLLTGFDAPSCTYLYIDKSMQDHGLFQAICRTNRLDGADKDFGYIVDYKDLFKKVEKAIAVYTSELDYSAGGADPQVMMKDRLSKGRERLDQALEALALLCELVEPPGGELEHIHYFCGNTEIPDDLKEREPQRVALYKAVAALLRAYGNIADELEAAGYSEADILRNKQELNRYVKLREIIRRASGETLDLKAYEADMRHLIDTYIEAAEPRKISPFDNLSLLELIVKTGIADAINNLPDGLKANKEAVAETIENNVRSKIIKEHLNDPAYYEKMSALLDEIIAARKAKAIEYEEYLKQIAELAKRVEAGQSEETPEQLNTPGRRALYNNLNQNEEMAIKIDETVKRIRPDGWRDVQAREQVIKAALYDILQDEAEVERIFPIIKRQREY
jgi:type I restriction enzyme R subunit